jgi:hypothetical protein
MSTCTPTNWNRSPLSLELGGHNVVDSRGFTSPVGSESFDARIHSFTDGAESRPGYTEAAVIASRRSPP